MSAFLTERQIKQQAEKIRSAFNTLMTSKRVVSRPESRQWQFFRHCFNVLMGETAGDFPCTAQTAAQYKFEVSKSLRHYYLLPGDPVSFVFSLKYKSGDRGVTSEDYPSTNGYVLLVTSNVTDVADISEAEAQLERRIADAVDAEWAVYMKLPQLDLVGLDEIFESTGSAYKRIRMIAESHHKKRWTINNPGNPSTRRLVRVKVEDVLPDSARVRTEEYWYLRWWSEEKNKYAYIYNEMNRQVYFLVKQGEQWLVRDNYYPTTRTSTPLRWNR